MYTQKEILNFISASKPFLAEHYSVSKIGLFGSYARNEQSDKSDVDLLVEFNEDTKNLFDIKMSIKRYFKEKLNLNVDLCRAKYLKPRYKNRILNEVIYVD